MDKYFDSDQTSPLILLPLLVDSFFGETLLCEIILSNTGKTYDSISLPQPAVKLGNSPGM